ncbi:hypothetical protein G7059_01690 [Erysipelothrix sp. HDW6A]|uniref:hypothetical protein n=1 Tax=Erysipelothrix sp. HDW6A TaxID=2714928 RepID=UPI001407C617|nr:hypothetical protein [Erysipelothrix sp. HDW6A]QIK56646.1 hypothetical protein G7059_01690 [Erysipelothrix sp. HDW6A]
MTKRGNEKEYAVYNGDEFQFIDSLSNCATRLGIKTEIVKWLSSLANIKRRNGKGCITVKLD